MKKKLNEIKPDYIYTTSPNEVLELFVLGKKIRKILVASEHGSYFGYNRFYTFIKKYTYPRIYCVSVLNKTDTQIYQSWGANAIYVPHLITYKAIKSNKCDTHIFLNVGRLTADKRQDLLIKAWAKIAEKKDWKLTIVGDGEEKQKLVSLINELNVKNSVVLCGATNHIEQIYQKASVFVLSSRFEGFGMVLLEAMSFGIPCISFDCPSGPRDIIKNGFNGFLVDNGNEEALIETLSSFIKSDISTIQCMGKNAFDTIVEWDNNKIIEKWLEIFK